MIQVALFSFVFIFCVHHLLLFLQNMLTFRKEKDLLYSPIEKYQTMYKQIETSPTKISSSPSHAADAAASAATSHEMKNELKEYMVNYLHGMA